MTAKRTMPKANNYRWGTTADQIVADCEQLIGKNIFITGSTHGIGTETVRSLARLNPSSIHMACRNEKLVQEVINEVQADTGFANIHNHKMDLCDLNSVRAAAEEFIALNIPLDILINNAGIMALPERTETAQGFERQFGVNHLAHFYLAKLLLPALKRAASENGSARVVSVASTAHKMGDVVWDDVNFDQGKVSYGSWKAYAQSKSANILFANEFNRLYGNDEHKIYANSIHPGVVKTNLATNMTGANAFFFKYVLGPFKSFFFKNAQQGAATQVYVAAHPDMDKIGGLYFDSSKPQTPMKHVRNVESGEKLWKMSEEMLASKGF
eukprot:Nk52_evm4s559 gene=Nk52_evmTU4s559